MMRIGRALAAALALAAGTLLAGCGTAGTGATAPFQWPPAPATPGAVSPALVPGTPQTVGGAPATAAATPAVAPVPRCGKHDVVIAAATDGLTYAGGRPVVVTATVRNVSAHPCAFTSDWVISVYGPTGIPIQDVGVNRCAGGPLACPPLAPGATFPVSWSWHQVLAGGGPAKPGSYHAEAQFAGFATVSTAHFRLLA